jgi:hypothetical protein
MFTLEGLLHSNLHQITANLQEIRQANQFLYHSMGQGQVVRCADELSQDMR